MVYDVCVCVCALYKSTESARLVQRKNNCATSTFRHPTQLYAQTFSHIKTQSCARLSSLYYGKEVTVFYYLACMYAKNIYMYAMYGYA